MRYCVLFCLSALLFLGLLAAGCRRSDPKQLSLAGEWEFTPDPSGTFSASALPEKARWRTARVPLSWQAQFPDLRDYQGAAWYRTSFILPGWSDSETVLSTFQAVDYQSEVYINGRLAGSHEGGYTPFTLEITPLVRPGENELLMRVYDPPVHAAKQGAPAYAEIPHGKQSWYLQTSGIWRDAAIQIRPRRHLQQVHITPAMDGTLAIELSFNRAGNSGGTDRVRLQIIDPNGHILLSERVGCPAAETRFAVQRHISRPLLWSPNTPQLYTLAVQLNRDEERRERFGFRSFAARAGRLYLNGEPFYLMGALDQDFYPESIYTTPSSDYLRDEMRKARAMGLNLLRCHIKVPDPRYLEIADETGLLVWCEIPNWDHYTPEAAARGMATFSEMVQRDWNHPSVVLYSLINESWGLDLQQSEQRKWLLEACAAARQLAPGRLIVDNSACWGNFHLQTALNDYHTYWAIPESRSRFDETIAELARRPDWLFSPFGDGRPTGQEPLLLSEFGNWGLPRLPQPLPFWFSRDFDGREVTLPAGVLDRFKAYGYDRIFGTYDRLADASQFMQFEALKYEIETIRLNPEIQGYVITEFTDVNWECNGLLDMWRHPKVFAEALGALQQPDVLVPRPDRYSGWVGDSLRIRLWVSHYSRHDLQQGSVVWRVTSGDSGRIPMPDLSRGDVRELAELRYRLPEVSKATKLRIDFYLKDQQGRQRAENYCAVMVYPALGPGGRLAVHWPDERKPGEDIHAALRKMGYQAAPGLASGAVILTNQLDGPVLAALKAGARVVCFAGPGTPLPSTFPLRIRSREEEWLDGNWASNLNWLQPDHPLFRGLVEGPVPGFALDGLPLAAVVDGIQPQDFQDVLAGMYIGWLHLSCGYIVQIRAGGGRLLLCTLPLLEQPDHPFAASLLGNMVDYLERGWQQPKLHWSGDEPGPQPTARKRQ